MRSFRSSRPRRLAFRHWPARRIRAAAGVGAVVLISTFALAIPGLGGPPYFVDDPGTAEIGHYELNTAYVSNQVRGSESQQFPNIEVSYGYANNVEFAVGLGLTSLRESGTARTTGLDDTEMEAKWRFKEENLHAPGLAFDYRLKVPTASRSRGLGTGRVDHTFELLAGKSIGRVTVFADGGYALVGSRDEQDSRFYGAAATYQATEKTNVGVQLYGNTPTAPGERSELAYGLAVTHNFTEDRALLLGAGHSFHGFSDLNVYVGMQFILGPENGTGEATAGPTPPAMPETPPRPRALSR